MASGQGGVGAVTALQSHHEYPGGPHWSPAVSQYQHQHQQQQHHTARSLDRALEDAVSSGILNLSGRKLREYPGMSYDLTDTTQAGGSLCVCVQEGCGGHSENGVRERSTLLSLCVGVLFIYLFTEDAGRSIFKGIMGRAECNPRSQWARRGRCRGV